MGSGVSFNIDDYPLEERKAVLEEKVSLEGIAEYIKAGKAKVSAKIVCNILPSHSIVGSNFLVWFPQF